MNVSEKCRVLTIIVNFGRPQETAKAIETVIGPSQGFVHDIVVWENGMSRTFDGKELGTRWVNRECTISYVGGRGNLGYAQGVNEAYAWWCRSVASEPHVVHCMNPDAHCIENALQKVCAALADSDWDVLGPVTRFDDGEVRPSAYPAIHPALGWLSFLRLGLYRRFGRRFEPGAKVEPVEVVDGAFLVVRGTAWRAANGLDGNYAISGDDQDFCRRVRASGGRVGLVTSAEVVHIGGTSRAARRTLSELSGIHSNLRYVAKFFPRWLLFSRISIAAASLVSNPNFRGVADAKWALLVPTSGLPGATVEEKYVRQATKLGGRSGGLLVSRLQAEFVPT